MNFFWPVVLLIALAVGSWFWGKMRGEIADRREPPMRTIEGTRRTAASPEPRGPSAPGFYVTNAFIVSTIVIGAVLAALMLFLTGIIRLEPDSGVTLPEYAPLVVAGMWALCIVATVIVLAMVSRLR